MNLKQLNDNEFLNFFIQSKLSYKKFAETYSITLGSLRSRLFRARNKRDVDNLQNDSITVEEKNDELTIDSTSKRIKTLEELLSACKVKLDDWEVSSYSCNAWEVIVKYDTTSEVETMYQVKAHLSKKHITFNPCVITIKPVKISKNSSKFSKVLVLSDFHIGYSDTTEFHDEVTINSMLAFIQSNPLDEIVLAGDIMDFTEFSDKFTRYPEYYFLTQKAIEYTARLLGRLRSVSNAKIVWIEGNHEHRLRKYLADRSNQLYGLKQAGSSEKLLSLQHLLDLDNLSIKYLDNYPNNQYRIGSTIIEHGHYGNLDRLKTIATNNRIVGHLHNTESRKKTLEDKTIGIYCSGCLCKVDGSVPGHKTSQQWQQGFALLTYDDTFSHIENVEIKNSRVFYHDCFYE